VKVSLWTPGVAEEIVESQHNGTSENVAERVASEALKKLDRSEHQEGQKQDLLSKMELGVAPISETGAPIATRRSRTKRVKIVSTPIGGGDMFAGGTEVFQPTAPLRRRRVKTMSTPISGDMWGDTTTVVLGPGEILINVIGPNDEKYAAKMKEETYKKLSQGGTPFTLAAVEEETQFVGQYLDGFVRRKGRNKSLSNLSFDEKQRL
jgi:hypothetical protein